MQEITEITGMIIKAEPIGEYDRRVVLLTREKGKISAFARGSRKPSSRLLAATNPFSFGVFKLYAGKSAYNIVDASISNYFEGLREDYESAYYGMYFLEVMDQSLRALMHEGLSNVLVRYIFEMKAMVINGEFPGMPAEGKWEESTRYAVSYIVGSGIEKLYTFTVTPPVLQELKQIADTYRARFVDRSFKSLEIVDNL